MGNPKSTRMTAAEIGLTPHEERLLQSYFSRRTRPYLAALLVLVCVLGAILSVGMPGRPAAEPQADAERLAAELEGVTAALRTQFDAEVAGLRRQLASLSAALEEAGSNPPGTTDAGARKRLDQVDASIRRLTKRLDELEQRTKSAEVQTLGFEDRQRVRDAAAGASPEVVPPASSEIAFE